MASYLLMTQPRLADRAALTWLAVALVVVYGVCAALARSLAQLQAPSLVAAAIAIDLTLTAGALIWWLGVRRAGLPSIVVPIAVALGAAIATRIPYAPTSALAAAGIALEVSILGVVVSRLPLILRTARAARLHGPIGALEVGFTTARLPARLAAILASEFGVLWLVLTGWARRAHRAEPALFSMRRTQWLLIAPILGWLLIVETVAFHLLLARWSHLAAWLATASSLYALLWLTADWHAVRLHPVTVQDGTLWIRLGVRWRGQVPLSAVRAVTQISSRPEHACDLALLEPSVLVELHQPMELRGPFGLRRHADRIALTIDEPERFAAAVLDDPGRVA